MRKPEYAAVIEPLSMEHGGASLAREEAARNVGDAIASSLEDARSAGRAIPEPRVELRTA